MKLGGDNVQAKAPKDALLLPCFRASDVAAPFAAARSGSVAR